jgi:hypothetical protein
MDKSFTLEEERAARLKDLRACLAARVRFPHAEKHGSVKQKEYHPRSENQRIFAYKQQGQCFRRRPVAKLPE